MNEETETAAVAESSPEILDQALDFVINNGMTFLINLIVAAAIFVIGKWIANAVKGMAEKAMIKAKLDETLAAFLSKIAYIAILLIVIIAALGRLGVPMMGFGAILAAAGLAIGLSLQGTLANFASGVMIILFKPFKLGDFVSAGGETGVIEEVHIFNTIMRTGDNVQIIIPNGSIIGGNITNFSAKDTRRIDLVFGCGYDDDIKAVKELLNEIVDTHPLVLKDPAPVVAVAELADSSINFVVRPWVKAADYWAVRWELNETVKTKFDEKGFSIPYPQQDVHMHQS